MYKYKEKQGYKLTYDTRLHKGMLFKTNTELKALLVRFNEYTDEAIEMSEDPEGLIEKRDRLETKIQNKRKEIKNLTQKHKDSMNELDKHNNGELDEIYNEIYNKREEDKQIRREKKYEKKTKTNTENKKVSQQFYSNSRQASSKDRYMKKQYDYHYRYFTRNSAKVPSFITTNLKSMPNNKGYIWRNIWFYGALPIPKKKIFNKHLNTYEHVEDNTLKMHEILRDKTVIRYKDNNGKWTMTTKVKQHNRNNDNRNNNNRNNNSRRDFNRRN